MAVDLGVTVVEVDGRAAPTLATAPTSTAGLLVRSERGVPHRPVRVRGVGDFTAGFGSFTPDAFGAHAVRGFFDNGGSDAFVVRLVGAGHRAASVDLVDRAVPAVATLRVTAGQGGSPDPGSWGNALSVSIADSTRGTSRVPAQVVGTTAEPFPVTGTTTFTVTLTSRGIPTPVALTLGPGDLSAPGTASAEEVAQAVNRQTTRVRAAVAPGGRLVLSATGADLAAWTRLEVTGAAGLGIPDGTDNDDGLPQGADTVVVAGATPLTPGSVVRLSTHGHVVGTAAPAASVPDGAVLLVSTDGGPQERIVLRSTDFADPAAVTAAEVAAAVNRTAVGVAAEVTSANALVLMSHRVGASSTVALAPPTDGEPDARGPLALETATPVDGVEAFRVLTAASESHRLLGWPADPQSAALPTGPLVVSAAELDLVVRRGTEEVERFEHLCMLDSAPNWAVAVVNDPSRGSSYVMLTDLASPSGAGLDLPAVGTAVLGADAATSGRNGDPPTEIEIIGDPSARTGVHALTDVPLQLVACPETTSAAVLQALLAWCERRGDAMAVGAVPRGLDHEGAKAYASVLRGRKVYGALYAPWIEVLNPLAGPGALPRIAVPPVGQVLGVYARTAQARGAWKAPAGDGARLVDAVGVEYDMTDADHTDLVRVGGVNGIRAVPGAGIVLDASRTLSTDPRWLYIGTRRLFNLVKSSLRDGLTFVQQEPHTEALRRSVVFNVVTPFLLGLWRQGAFGSDPAEDVFTVRCDGENNPPADVALGLFTLEAYFYPAKPAESILVVVGQQDSGASASDS